MHILPRWRAPLFGWGVAFASEVIVHGLEVAALLKTFYGLPCVVPFNLHHVPGSASAIPVLAGVAAGWCFAMDRIYLFGRVSTRFPQCKVFAQDHVRFPCGKELFLAFSHPLLSKKGFGNSMVCVYNVEHSAIGVMIGVPEEEEEESYIH